MTDRLLKLREVITKTGFGRSSIYNHAKDKGFPKPKKVGRSVRWRESEVDAWIETLTSDGAGKSA